MFYHVLDMRKVLEGGRWNFEQSLLVYHPLTENEDPHMPELNKMDILIQVYNLLTGCISETILQGIGNFVGTFDKSDPVNLDRV